jgi:hypothetical protein
MRMAGGAAHILRGLIEILARQAAIDARRTSDRLWEDQFIQTCDDWAVPYIGNLLGTRLVGSLNRRARASTSPKRSSTGGAGHACCDGGADSGHHRMGRRRGGKFQAAARTRHRLDPEPARFSGPLTRTPPGAQPICEMGEPATFSTGHSTTWHTPDFRQIGGIRVDTISEAELFPVSTVCIQGSQSHPLGFR